MADYQNFRIKTGNYLGFEYEDFRNKMYAIALADPKSYYTIRNDVVKGIRDETVEKFFNVFYAALTEGKRSNPDGTLGAPLSPHLPPPNFPAQSVAEICLQAGRTIHKIVDDVIEKIIPISFEQLAKARTHDRAAALGLDN